jgi:di/tripeptidase
MFSGYTLSRARGWYWDEKKGIGVSDELIRCEIDGVFTGNELHTLHAWRKKLLRRFKQDYIYMRLVVSGTAL